MVTTGVTGGSWRATITPWGAVAPWDGTPLDWYVAADDRWHVPARESTVRQRRIAGTPVTETRVRVPTGDVVQRVSSVADRGGITIVEVENESTMPVAVAFDHREVLSDRPITDVPIEGIELPPAAFVRPLGHRATLRVGLAHRPPTRGVLPVAAGWTRVVSGWRASTDRASRFELPDGAAGGGLADAVVGARCELLLGVLPDDPAERLVAIGELVRLGDDAAAWVDELAAAVEAAAPSTGWAADAGLTAAGRVLALADERRAGADLARIVAGRTASLRPSSPPPDGPLVIPWLESSIACRGELLPFGLPAAWLGQSIEVHGVPTGDRSSVSFALRWHGDRPAVLWEQAGEPVRLTAPTTAPGWSTRAVSGEALWPASAPVAGGR